MVSKNNDDLVSGGTGDETDQTRVFLTHGTTEEGLDSVSVFQPVPHTGKHFQSGCVTVKQSHRGGGRGRGRQKWIQAEGGRKGRRDKG